MATGLTITGMPATIDQTLQDVGAFTVGMLEKGLHRVTDDVTNRDDSGGPYFFCITD